MEWYIQKCIPVERLSFSSSFSESNTTKISMHYKHKMHKQQQQQRSRDTGWESQSFLNSVNSMSWDVTTQCYGKLWLSLSTVSVISEQHANFFDVQTEGFIPNFLKFFISEENNVKLFISHMKIKFHNARIIWCCWSPCSL